MGMTKIGGAWGADSLVRGAPESVDGGGTYGGNKTLVRVNEFVRILDKGCKGFPLLGKTLIYTIRV